MNIDIEQLKQAAQAASACADPEQPWQRTDHTVFQLMHAGWHKGREQFQNRITISVTPSPSTDGAETVAAFIAAANPAVVLELVARLERAEAATLRYRAVRVDGEMMERAWQALFNIITERGGNLDNVSDDELMRASFEAALSAQPAPSHDRDAYEGAREDLLDWKARAQRAEARLRTMGYTGTDTSESARPVRSGVVSDEQVKESSKIFWSILGDPKNHLVVGTSLVAMRAALEHFAKSLPAVVSGDKRSLNLHSPAWPGYSEGKPAPDGWTCMDVNNLTAPTAESVAQGDDTHAFKNFHRSLCERFGYTHDENDWRRDQVSLIEFIAAHPTAPVGVPDGMVSAGPQHGDDAGDGLRYILCKVGLGDHLKNWLLIPHANGQYVTAAKLVPFSMEILKHHARRRLVRAAGYRAGGRVMAMKARLVVDIRAQDASPGDIELRRYPDGSVGGYAYRCPGCGQEDWLRVDDGTHGWTLGGLADAPTLRPSILHRTCGWHGYLTNGEFAPC